MSININFSGGPTDKFAFDGKLSLDVNGEKLEFVLRRVAKHMEHASVEQSILGDVHQKIGDVLREKKMWARQCFLVRK